jgi:hypothetical protein
MSGKSAGAITLDDAWAVALNGASNALLKLE